jgi:hypothetical protein
MQQLGLRQEVDWGVSDNWLCTAINIIPQGSLLWKAIWSIWLLIRKGLRKSKLKTHDELLRQPLYLNAYIQRTTGHPYGTERNLAYMNCTVKESIW